DRVGPAARGQRSLASACRRLIPVDTGPDWPESRGPGFHPRTSARSDDRPLDGPSAAIRLLLSRSRDPLALTPAYALARAAWIRFSDAAWARLTNRTIEELQQIQTLKGTLYVLVTGVLLWGLVRWAVEAVASAEAERRESEERYRQVFERTSSVCLLIDVETLQIVDANPAAERFYGWTRQELVGMLLSQINTMEAPVLLATVKAAADEGGKTFVVRHRLRSGAERDVE